MNGAIILLLLSPRIGLDKDNFTITLFAGNLQQRRYVIPLTIRNCSCPSH